MGGLEGARGSRDNSHPRVREARVRVEANDAEHVHRLALVERELDLEAQVKKAGGGGAERRAFFDCHEPPAAQPGGGPLPGATMPPCTMLGARLLLSWTPGMPVGV